jgi:tricorn protease-like protein
MSIKLEFHNVNLLNEKSEKTIIDLIWNAKSNWITSASQYQTFFKNYYQELKVYYLARFKKVCAI